MRIKGEEYAEGGKRVGKKKKKVRLVVSCPRGSTRSGKGGDLKLFDGPATSQLASWFTAWSLLFGAVGMFIIFILFLV